MAANRGSFLLLSIFTNAFLLLNFSICGSYAGESKEPVEAEWQRILPHVEMPPQLARHVSPLTSAQISAALEDLQQNGIGALSNICQSGGLLCNKDDIQKLDPCSINRYKKRKLLDSMDDGLVTCYFTDGDENSMGSGSRGSEESVFFREEDIRTVGRPLKFPNLHEHPTARKISFLPRRIAERIGFNSRNVMDIVRALQVPEFSSMLLQRMSYTLQQCEEPPSRIETKTCATSVHDIARFVNQTLDASDGKKMRALDVVPCTANLTLSRTVTVADAKLVNPMTSKHVTCHSVLFPFQVYYCHYVRDTNVYSVTLRTEEGETVKNVIAECHVDTTVYPADSPMFSSLHLKPGEGEFCHWVTADSLVFSGAAST